ncbi:MAG: hypothetical protein WA254_12630 [Candidatus Sulfotelmatobacter sp.]
MHIMKVCKVSPFLALLIALCLPAVMTWSQDINCAGDVCSSHDPKTHTVTVCSSLGCHTTDTSTADAKANLKTRYETCKIFLGKTIESFDKWSVDNDVQNKCEAAQAANTEKVDALEIKMVDQCKQDFANNVKMSKKLRRSCENLIAVNPY